MQIKHSLECANKDKRRVEEELFQMKDKLREVLNDKI